MAPEAGPLRIGASSSGFVVREEDLLEDLGSGSPGGVIFEPQRLEPPSVAQGGEREEPGLGKRDLRLEEHGPRDDPRLLGAGPELHLVAGEWLPFVLDGKQLCSFSSFRFCSYGSWDCSGSGGSPPGEKLALWPW